MALSVEDCPAAALDGLALHGLGLLGDAAFEQGAAWWRLVADTAMPAGSRARFVLVRQDGAPLLLLPLRLDRRGGASGLTTPYTCCFQPPCLHADRLGEAGLALARCLPPVLRLDALDPAWDGWAPLLRGLRRGGRRHAWFAGFGNWRERLGGRNWAGYLADRPGSLRETIRRRLRHAERDPNATFRLVVDADAVPGCLAEYEAVRAASWKAAEPFPDFAGRFASSAARAGVLRMAVLHRGGRPVAAQYWTVEQGHAILHKLVHDETSRAQSPGTVLTAWMIRRLIEEEQVTTLDFGRGDDPYKRQWATERQQRAGLVLADPWHPLGAAALLRQAGGDALRRWREQGLGRQQARGQS